MKVLCGTHFVAPTPTQAKILGVLAGVVLLGELFLILGACQVLPAGVNAISRLGAGVMGIALVLPLPVVALALRMMSRKKMSVVDQPEGIVIKGSVASLQEHPLLTAPSASTSPMTALQERREAPITAVQERRESQGALTSQALVRALGVHHAQLQADLPIGEIVFEFSVQTEESGDGVIRLATILLKNRPGLPLDVELTVHKYHGPREDHLLIEDRENSERELAVRAQSVSTRTLETLLENAKRQRLSFEIGMRPCLQAVTALENVLPDFLSQLFKVPNLRKVHFDIMTREHFVKWHNSIQRLALCEEFSANGAKMRSQTEISFYEYAPLGWGWGGHTVGEVQGPGGESMFGAASTGDSRLQKRFKELKACAQGAARPQQLEGYAEGTSASAHVQFERAPPPLSLPSSEHLALPPA